MLHRVLMHRLPTVAVLGLVFGGCLQAPSPSGVERLEVKVSPSKQRTLLLEPVVVTVELWNRSSIAKTVSLPKFEYGLGSLTIKDPSGRLRTPGALGDELAAPQTTTLAPGERVQNAWLLHYDSRTPSEPIFGMPGSYEIQARFSDEVADPSGVGTDRKTVYSNTVRITVSDPTGDDEKACELFRGDEVANLLRRGGIDAGTLSRCQTLIQQYPATTYTAYVRYGLGHDQLSVAANLGGWEEHERERVRLFDECLSTFETLLRESPEFPLAAEARYAIAKAHYLKGRYQLQELRLHDLDWLWSLRVYDRIGGNVQSVQRP